MISRITAFENQPDTINLLRKEGIFIVENYIQGTALQKLHQEVLFLCEQKGGYYELGRNYRGGDLASHKADSLILFDTFNQEWMKNLNSSYRNQVFCDNIFATYDFKPPSDGSAKNSWLHYDKHRCLKFFIYLTDIDKDSGAFYCSPYSIKKTQTLRKTIKDYAKERRLEETFPELVKKYPPEAVEGKAGTLIVFDTDCFHKGGKCQKGKSRLVVRGHCT